MSAARTMARVKHITVNMADSPIYFRMISFFPDPRRRLVAISPARLPARAVLRLM